MNSVVETKVGTEDFGRLAEPFRRELLAYCYRMLGSVEEAEEVVQEVLLDAWRAYDGFEGRSSLRTWLYRIAARACFKALEKGRRRPLPADLGGPQADPDAALGRNREVPWLQPIPDFLFTAAPDDPATIVVERQTMRLALMGALQQLPPRQRAVLILRDVLQWRAAEVAELLEISTAAVNSALQRARAQVPISADDLTEPVEPDRRTLLNRYVSAFETADVDQLVAVLTEDARWEMPPIAAWFEGRDTILAFLARQMRLVGPAMLVPTSANGQAAFGVYARGRDGTYRSHALHVLTITAAGVSRVVAFHGPDLFPLFGL
ncbi:sigma-70 family RNA polymerase sigma factor [Nocardia sp. CDC153]|uniref:sigma-70 family RNA polymerase sigma factor n=1 Tax=Nocardia sp. CDC153 TaxID=3112167 RepID=UPI002DC060A0|nr:sigma-70 family RNA polymerase sigma factor [Nocardia sp. CDC153]MEC3956394.1 sigma-70 family RNA polymerase sigma factor [Nocardia sp. CDC153]